MAKVRLLNSGGYHGLLCITFPVVVDGEPFLNWKGVLVGYDIMEDELVRVGAEIEQPDGDLFFSYGDECIEGS